MFPAKPPRLAMSRFGEADFKMKTIITGSNLVSLIQLGNGQITIRRYWHEVPKHGRAVGALTYDGAQPVLVTMDFVSEVPRAQVTAIADVYEILSPVPSALFEGLLEAFRLTELEPDPDKAVAAFTRALCVDAERVGDLMDVLLHIPSLPKTHFRAEYYRALVPYTANAAGEDRSVIRGTPNSDDWECLCGNDGASDGFYPVYNGHWIEPLKSGPWDGILVACAACGRIIDQTTTKVVGRLSDEALSAPQP